MGERADDHYEEDAEEGGDETAAAADDDDCNGPAHPLDTNRNTHTPLGHQ